MTTATPLAPAASMVREEMARARRSAVMSARPAEEAEEECGEEVPVFHGAIHGARTAAQAEAALKGALLAAAVHPDKATAVETLSFPMPAAEAGPANRVILVTAIRIVEKEGMAGRTLSAARL